jgi:hypothetical protein
MKKYREIASFVSNIVVIVGLPLAIFQYYSTTKKENLDREYEIYNSLDNEFKQWELLCLEHSELDIFDVPDSVPAKMDGKQMKEEVILFTVLFSLFERAYVLYADVDTEIKRSQWAGWNEYILSYCQRENFRKAWQISGNTFEEGFQNYMKIKIDSIEAIPIQQAPNNQ